MSGYAISQRWDVDQLGALMAVPEIYWAVTDRLAPQPEQMDFRAHLCHPSVTTFAASYDHNLIGYVQFVRRTSIGSEMHGGFLAAFRGRIAKAMFQYSMAEMFKRGYLKLWSPIPSDNKPARYGAAVLGMQVEGRLSRAVIREAGIVDLILYGITREQFLQRGVD